LGRLGIICQIENKTKKSFVGCLGTSQYTRPFSLSGVLEQLPFWSEDDFLWVNDKVSHANIIANELQQAGRFSAYKRLSDNFLPWALERWPKFCFTPIYTDFICAKGSVGCMEWFHNMEATTAIFAGQGMLPENENKGG
jgi:hypothetical protein